MNGYLLDTGHSSRFLDGHPVIVRRVSQLARARLATCPIVRGELVFMAQMSERREANLGRVLGFFGAIEAYPVDGETGDAYGRLKAALMNRFGPREKARRRTFKIERLGFRDNDLWIAATAIRHGLTLVSADSDFERIAQVEELRVERWWVPELG